MGQYEGEIRGKDDLISYGCGLSSSVSFSFPGHHLGPVDVVVDGTTIRSAEVNPSADGTQTYLRFEAGHDSKTSEKHAFDYLIHAIAEGSEIMIRQDAKTLASWTLKGSSEITNCAIN